MTIFHTITRKLLVAAFALATVSTLSLDAMKRLKESNSSESSSEEEHQAQESQRVESKNLQLSLFSEYLIIKEVCTLCVESNVCFAQELVQYIFYLILRIGLIDPIAQNSTIPDKFIIEIAKHCKIYEPGALAPIVVLALKKTNVSLFTVKRSFYQTIFNKASSPLYDVNILKTLLLAGYQIDKNKLWEVLFISLNKMKPLLKEVIRNKTLKSVEALVEIAKKFGPDKLWNLLCIRNCKGIGVLDVAIDIDGHSKFRNPIIEILLDAAESVGTGKAWELINRKDEEGETAFTYSTGSLQNIMLKYKPKEH